MYKYIFFKNVQVQLIIFYKNLTILNYNIHQNNYLEIQ